MVNVTPPAEANPTRRKKDARLSKDGNWRLFPQEKHLLQYVSTGMYFGRVKVGGKAIRRKLDTTVTRQQSFDYSISSRSEGPEAPIAAKP